MTKKKSSNATTKKTAKKSASGKSSAKKTVKKAPAKKAPAKKKVAKKTAKKAPAKEKVAKKTAKKAPAKKTVAKKTVKKAPAKAPAQRPSSKKTTKKTGGKPAVANSKTAAADAAKSGRKGITIVDNKKPHRRPRSSAKAKLPPRPDMPSLLGPGSRFKGPLIPSGPKNKVKTTEADADASRKKKSPFNKRQLDKFKEILLRKRAEVFGDLEELETGALRSGGGGGGNLSNLPPLDAEQGSDSADQNLSLNLAEADRILIREIDAALERIAGKTYGLCALTGQPISVVRLEELPWALYSIEAARRLERGQL
ncbi:MAG: RNA polymerase-binding transcription factor DksA [Phycisphaerales bacterium]